jgi:hypothetical protein
MGGLFVASGTFFASAVSKDLKEAVIPGKVV